MSTAFTLYDTSACFDSDRRPAQKPVALHRAWRPVEVPQPVCPCGLDIDLEQYVVFVAALACLTPKETQIMLYLFKGLSTKEMASALGNTEKTLKHHVASVFQKLRVSSRPELIATIFNLNNVHSHVPTCPCGLPIDFVGYIIFAAFGADLTAKETTVLLYLCQGLATKEMASTLGNTEKTLKHHIASIFHKFGTGSRTELFNTIFPL